MSDDGMERIDEDPNATTGDTRIRVDGDENETYVLRREKYGLVEFQTAGMSDDGESFEQYDWHTEERFVVRGDWEAKQFAQMLRSEGAFDPVVLFHRQFDPDDLDLSDVRERIELAMAAVTDDDSPTHEVEQHLQHAHAELGGEKEEMYRHVDTGSKQTEGDR